jgi:SlyX protein
MEDRLTEVESRLAFAEDLLDTLNQTVVRQQAQIDLLQEQLRLLHRQIKDVQGAEPRSLREEIPPHY